MKKTVIKYALLILLGLSCSVNFHAQTIINMEQSGGVYYIPCEVNGLGLKFVFDTGASNVSISMSEALFMLKNDYLRESDIKGTNRYRTASGSIEEGTSIILRQIKIGDKYLYNVEASIVNSLDAPLLLGQSALSKLGNISVDYSKNQLIIGSNTQSSSKPAPSSPEEYFSSGTQSNTSNHESWTPPKGAIPVDEYLGHNEESRIESVSIGHQVWMAKNLNVVRFRNGDPIPQAQSVEGWKRAGELKQPAWCYYDNDPTNGAKYGKLYNWYAVNDPRGLAPNGWHIPSDTDWTHLTNYLGGFMEAGRKMKSASGWDRNGNGTNTSDFSGLPGGLRLNDGTFELIGIGGIWWSSTENDTYNARSRLLGCDNDVAKSYNYSKKAGFSVRCLKD